MKFVNEKDVNQPIHVSGKIDEDGDFAVTANGIDLFYLRASDGTVHRYYLGDDRIQALRQLGFRLDGNRVMVEKPEQ